MLVGMNFDCFHFFFHRQHQFLTLNNALLSLLTLPEILLDIVILIFVNFFQFNHYQEIVIPLVLSPC